MEAVRGFIFWGSKITADGDCSHEIKRHLLLGRKVMTNLGSILISRDITLSTKVCLVKAMVFPVVMCGCESWTIILGHSTFLMVQWSYPHITSGKTIALTRWIFVGKRVSLLFNTLSRFFIVFLPSNKSLLVSWLQSLSAVILEPKEIKSATISIVSPFICHEVMRPDDMILVF